MELSIIIPTFNRVNIATLTIQTILKILPKITSNYQIIVVNDGEENFNLTDNNLEIYKNPKKGVASARNYGVSKAKYRNLLFLDDDMILTEDALRYYFSFFNDIDRSKQYCLNIKWEMPKELILKCKKTSFGRVFLNGNDI
ncbi:MAG: glycosyltransferase family 2 protein [Bacteroidales bacterium]